MGQQEFGDFRSRHFASEPKKRWGVFDRFGKVKRERKAAEQAAQQAIVDEQRQAHDEKQQLLRQDIQTSLQGIRLIVNPQERPEIGGFYPFAYSEPGLNTHDNSDGVSFQLDHEGRAYLNNKPLDSDAGMDLSESDAVHLERIQERLGILSEFVDGREFQEKYHDSNGYTRGHVSGNIGEAVAEKLIKHRRSPTPNLPDGGYTFSIGFASPLVDTRDVDNRQMTYPFSVTFKKDEAGVHLFKVAGVAESVGTPEEVTLDRVSPQSRKSYSQRLIETNFKTDVREGLVDLDEALSKNPNVLNRNIDPQVKRALMKLLRYATHGGRRMDDYNERHELTQDEQAWLEANLDTTHFPEHSLRAGRLGFIIATDDKKDDILEIIQNGGYNGINGDHIGRLLSHQNAPSCHRFAIEIMKHPNIFITGNFPSSVDGNDAYQFWTFGPYVYDASRANGMTFDDFYNRWVESRTLGNDKILKDAEYPGITGLYRDSMPWSFLEDDGRGVGHQLARLISKKAILPTLVDNR